MKQQGILHTIADGVRDACHIWYDELRLVLKDEGVLIFFVIVPLIYPLLYSWIYNNETVREVPVVVVDDSHSAMSRQFIRMCDASPDVQIKYYASDIDEAQMLMGRQQIVKAIYRIPADFESNLMRMQQSVVSVYCDMSLMLTYKAAYQTALAVSQTMNKEIQIQLAGRYTKREEQIQAAPLQCDDVALYNPGGGYGSAILPAVLMLILQQTLVLGIGMAAGTARETNRFSDLVPIQSHYHGTFRIVLGKAMVYFMIYAVMGTWLTVVVPRIFNFPHLAQWYNLLMLMLPYTLACIFYVTHGLCLHTAVVPQWCLVATVCHPRLLARHLMAVPLYLRCTSLCPSELYGWFYWRCPDRVPDPLAPRTDLFRHRLSGLSSPDSACLPSCRGGNGGINKNDNLFRV